MRSHAVSHARFRLNNNPNLYKQNLGPNGCSAEIFSVRKYWQSHKGPILVTCRPLVTAHSEHGPAFTYDYLGHRPKRCSGQVKASPSMPQHETLLTVNDVAQLLSVSPRTVNRLITSGAIESVSIGRCRRIRQRAVDRFIDTLQREQRQQEVGF